MYHLLKESSLQPGGDVIFQELRRVRAGLRLSIEQIKNYRRMNPRFLPGNHILIRLLQSITVGWRGDAEFYNDRVADMALQLGQSLKMTSALSRGQVWRPGPFLGGRVTEVLIANIDDWDVKEGMADWAELKPIRFLHHPMYTLKMPVPDAQFASPEPGVAVISINIPMLACQYRAWRESNRGIDESPRTIAQFLQAYPLPNMIESQLDLAIFNRLVAKFFGHPIPAETFRHPFFLIDWSREVDAVLERYLTVAKPKRWDLDTLVSHIPTVASENLHKVLALPDMAYSVQLQWAIMLARLQLITFLVQFNHQTHNARNQPYLNYIRRWLQYMDGNNTMKSAMPGDLYDDVSVMIDRGIAPYL